MNKLYRRAPWIVLLGGMMLVWSTKNVSHAGTVELSGGGQLTGSVERNQTPEGKTAHVIVRVDPDLAIAVAGVHVRRAVVSTSLDEYRAKAAAAGEDAEAHYELARWCKSAKLLNQYTYHLQRTIAYAPDHPRARAALGYVVDRGKWVSFQALKSAQGLVKDRQGRWVLPAVLSSRNLNDEADKNAKLWIKTFRQLQAKALRGDAEAFADIQAIDDPLASDAIAKELVRTRKTRNNNRTLRMAYVRLLGKLKSGIGIRSLVEAGVAEPDETIREEALRQLTQTSYGRSSAVASYLPLLRSNSPAQVKAAARALAFFPDQELAMQYVSALVTQQKVRIKQGSDGTQAGFGSNGSSGLTSGSRTIERELDVRHPEVLSLVKTIAPEVDFGYNERAWLAYFAGVRSPPQEDLRRDP